MDQLRPRLVTVGDSLYRHREEVFARQFDEEDCFEERNGSDDWTPEEERQWCLEYLSQDRYKAILDVPSAFYGSLIGKKGSAIKELQAHLKVKINFPPRGGSEERLTVLGKSKGTVVAACRRIMLRIQDIRSKMDWTHFLSIPLHQEPVLVNSLRDFTSKASLLEPSLDESIFQSPERIHLTIQVMSLYSEAELVLAKETLEECLEDIVSSSLDSGGGLKVSVSGIQIMNDDPSSVSVIYAQVHSDALQKICDGIADRFVARGIAPSTNNAVKLHITLMNTKFVSQLAGVPKTPFDASKILQNLKNHDFGSFNLQEIHLSKMNADKKSMNGYYESAHIITF